MDSKNNLSNEEKRLLSLKVLNILDTEPEAEFDDITFIASQVTQCPIALISFIDENRQWIKSKVGVSLSEVSRHNTFCTHTIQKPYELIVSNTLENEFFKNNTYVLNSPFIRFYAGIPILSPDGLPIGTLCVLDTKSKNLVESQVDVLKALSRQVTKLLSIKKNFNELENLNKKLKYKGTVTDSISEGMVLQDIHGVIVDYNPAALCLLGVTADQLLGKTSYDDNWKAITESGDHLPGEQHPPMIAIKTGKNQLGKIMGIHADEERFKWLIVNSIPITLNPESQSPSHVVSTFADISEVKNLEKNRRELELKLAENSKLSALGEMAGGMAHEINNPLTIIKAKAMILKRRLMTIGPDQEKDEKDLKTIEITVDRIAKIIKSLRTYSREANADPIESLNCLNSIEEALELCKERMRSDNIQVFIECPNDLYVGARPTQLSQIILNLILNSRDAILDKEEKWIKFEIFEKNKKIHFKFSDSGNGIPKEIHEKIMQPFFTTKEIGKGTGLGLSISCGLAHSNNGSLIYCPDESHTTFLLTLPKANEINLNKIA